jgi:hypothetical protein
MAFTRNQAKQQQQKQQQQQQTIQSNNYLPANSNIYALHSSPHPHPHPHPHSHSHLPNRMIDFIDASIEWRKNKIKGDNCTFEYI